MKVKRKKIKLNIPNSLDYATSEELEKKKQKIK